MKIQRVAGHGRPPLTTVAGGAAERLDVVPLPEPVEWNNIDRWTRMFSHDRQSGRIERCLFTAYHLGYQDKILPLLYECVVEPHFLSFADNLLSLGYLAEVIESFGWEQSSELVFNLGAKLLGRERGEPERFRRDAVGLMTSMAPGIDGSNAAMNGTRILTRPAACGGDSTSVAVSTRVTPPPRSSTPPY